MRTATLLRNRVDPRPQLFIIHYSLFIKIPRLGHPSFNQVPCTPGLPSPHDKLQFIEILSRRHPTFRHFQFTNFPSRKIKLCGQRLYFGTELTRDHNYSLFTIHYSLKSHGSGCQFSVKHHVPRHCRRHATK